jgi:DNA-binding Lrp family transcriptional regulator
MKKKGIIQGFVTFLDSKKIGYQFFKICISLQDQDALAHIVSFGIQHPNVVHVIETIGSWEIEFEVETKNFEDLFILQNELKNAFAPAIKKTTSIIIVEEKKLTFIPEN